MPELAGYALTEQTSRRRVYPEGPHPYRSDFQRDRDRIIHCEAFRRLEGKTQVFTVGTNDNYRNRLTHSIEVAQIGRTIARALRINEDLTEAICLAHDIGHGPFGHAGEAVLDTLMAGHGGFEHNSQALRIVELAEHPYPEFAGLNLMYETRLGLAKHRSPYDTPEDHFEEKLNSLEGQATDAADRIAYNCHDLEDGMRAKILHIGQLEEIELFRQAQKKVQAASIDDQSVRRIRTAKAIIDILASDCIEASRIAVEKSGVNSPQEVYGFGRTLVGPGSRAEKNLQQLEAFLMENLYRHRTLAENARQAKEWIEVVFAGLCKKPALMPEYYQHLVQKEGLERVVCDYVAGMTDRFCISMSKQI